MCLTVCFDKYMHACIHMCMCVCVCVCVCVYTITL